MEKLIYKNRRESLKNHLPENCALIIPGADLQYRNADSSYLLRQESSFFYFSGFCEPSSLMVMVNNGKSIDSIIFVPEKDKLREIWDGYRAGPIGAVDEYLFDRSFENNKIDQLVPELLQGVEKVFYPIGKKEGFDQKVPMSRGDEPLCRCDDCIIHALGVDCTELFASTSDELRRQARFLSSLTLI